LSELLESAGIPVLHYKGPLASQLLYGDRCRRTYFDLDFLVRRDDLRAVSRLLRDAGYRCDADPAESQEHIEREQKEYAFVSGLICVEPHWSLTARRYPFPIDYASLWEQAVVYDLAGVKLRTFCPADMLLILSVVGAKGQWKRLQMVTDVAQFYRSMDSTLAEPVLEHARQVGCERIVLVGAQLAETLLEAPIPAAIRARIDDDRHAIERICRRVIGRLFEATPQSHALLGNSPHVFSPLLFQMRERRRDRLAYLVRATTTPTGLHMRRFRLPAWAYPAYRLIVPVHDYLAMPVARGIRASVRPLLERSPS
jgi:hypothetical protein